MSTNEPTTNRDAEPRPLAELLQELSRGMYPNAYDLLTDSGDPTAAATAEGYRALMSELRDAAARAQRDADALQTMAGYLWPERFPPGHERHDSTHQHWAGEPEPGECSEWDGDTLPDIALVVDAARPLAE